MAEANAKLQNKAARNIKRKILDLSSPKETASRVPTIGLKTIGVKNARPFIPNRIQNLTTFLFLGENNFLSCRKVVNHQSLTTVPPKENKSTEDIIPKVERIAVSTIVRPANMPVVGPSTNLSMLTKKTVQYLNILSPILKSTSSLNFFF